MKDKRYIIGICVALFAIVLVVGYLTIGLGGGDNLTAEEEYQIEQERILYEQLRCLGGNIDACDEIFDADDFRDTLNDPDFQDRMSEIIADALKTEQP